MRQTSRYYDEDRAVLGLSPQCLDADQALEVLQMIRRAFATITDDTTVAIGFVICVVLAMIIARCRGSNNGEFFQFAEETYLPEVAPSAMAIEVNFLER